MQVKELIPFIRSIINDAATKGDAFTAETDAALLDFLLAAAKQIALMPGFQNIPSIASQQDGITFKQRPDGMYYAIISAPEDYLSPVSVWIESWVTPVYAFLPVTDSLYHAQLSSVKGVGNGPSLPVAFLVTQQDTVIIAHSVKSAGNYEFRYIPAPSINTEDQLINMPDKYRECLAYTAAALYLQSVSEFDASKLAFDTASTYLQTINKENS